MLNHTWQELIDALAQGVVPLIHETENEGGTIYHNYEPAIRIITYYDEGNHAQIRTADSNVSLSTDANDTLISVSCLRE